MEALSISVCDGDLAAPLVNPFYEEFGFSGRARSADTFFIARMEHIIVGAVRFCVEENTPMLRTMMVHEQYRGQRIGERLLRCLASYADSQSIRNIFCLPYAHLEKFYGKVGFEACEATIVPRFLIERLRLYEGRGEHNICMRRP